MTPTQLISATALFGGKELLDDLEKVLQHYSKWDDGEWDFFDQYLDECLDETRLSYLWRYLECSGISIRPTGHEFILNK